MSSVRPKSLGLYNPTDKGFPRKGMMWKRQQRPALRRLTTKAKSFIKGGTKLASPKARKLLEIGVGAREKLGYQ